MELLNGRRNVADVWLRQTVRALRRHRRDLHMAAQHNQSPRWILEFSELAKTCSASARMDTRPSRQRGSQKRPAICQATITE